MVVSQKENKRNISACIVTYNNDPDAVIETAESFICSYESVSLTIVDNNSTSDILSILERKYKKNKKVQVISSGKNGGYGYGHNFGLKNSFPARYHLVLNPDVIVHKGAIKKLIKYMNAHPEVVMMGPRVLNPDGSMQYLNKRLPTLMDLFARRFLPPIIQNWSYFKRRLNRYTMMDIGYDKITEVPFLSGSFMLLRKDILHHEPLFDERFFMYFEDADLSRRISKYGKVVYFPDAVITHQWARFAHKKIKFMFIFIQSAFQYFNKWGWRIF